MEKNFNQAVLTLVRQGMDTFEALKKVEESGEFSEEEIAEWWDGLNNRGRRKK